MLGSLQYPMLLRWRDENVMRQTNNRYFLYINISLSKQKPKIMNRNIFSSINGILVILQGLRWMACTKTLYTVNCKGCFQIQHSYSLFASSALSRVRRDAAIKISFHDKIQSRSRILPRDMPRDLFPCAEISVLSTLYTYSICEFQFAFYCCFG